MKKREMFDERVSERIAEVVRKGKRVLWTGDFKSVLHPGDAHDWMPDNEGSTTTQSMTDWERENLNEIVRNNGFTVVTTPQDDQMDRYTLFHRPPDRKPQRGRS